MSAQTFWGPMLAHTWSEAVDPTGWWVSVKLDGVRAYWDGIGGLYSRRGNRFAKAPVSLLESLPQGVPLDGELYLGPGLFEDTIRAVKGSAGWSQLTYQVFDAPATAGPVERRWRVAEQHWPDVLAQGRVASLTDLQARLQAITARGGEGLMLRRPESLYTSGRTRDLLKVKAWRNVDAVVTGFELGKGKHAGRLGALVCTLDSGAVVRVGTGLTDAQRAAFTPGIGAVVRIKYQELTAAGVPRFPVLVAA